MKTNKNELQGDNRGEEMSPSPDFKIQGRKRGKTTFLNHYQMELARVRTELRLSSYILKTTEKPITPYFPNVWNGLKPYFSTIDPEFVDRLPNDVFVGGKSRITVQNMVDPEVDVRIDQTKVSLPDIHLTRRQLLTQQKREHEDSSNEGPINLRSKPIRYSEKRGSTRLTPFAKVRYIRPEVARKKGIINFADVRLLRQQMRAMYFESSKLKDEQDYERTRQDFYRMDINVARERAHPENRYSLDHACRSYFGPSRGSLRAFKHITINVTTAPEVASPLNQTNIST